MRKIWKYFKLWLLLSKTSFLSVLNDQFSFLIFLTGKIIRFGLYLSFLFFLVKGTGTLSGYNLQETIFFFLTFNCVDVLSQFLFREVYHFRNQVVSGNFDLVLVKPVNALFRVLMGGSDFTDLVTIPPLLFVVWFVGSQLNPSFLQVGLYLILIVNSLIIATAFHIAVLAFGIVTLEVDHTIMIYRDIIALGKFPIDIYKEPVRSALTFLLPVGIMVSFPAKSLMGLISPIGIFTSLPLGVALFIISLKFWGYALKKYSSASS